MTPAKRYSFLVGENEHAYTAQKQLLPVLQNVATHPGVEELESCFSIEKVTDEFFAQYKELYLAISEHLARDKGVQKIIKENSIDSTRFAKKLLGQVVFLYFLQKKGWLGVPKNEPWGKGDRKFVQTLFDEAVREKLNFFKDYLQPLFYEALAKVRHNSPDPSYYKRFDCKIPALNGGLFESDYDWAKANLTIPNSLFRNKEKNEAGDVGSGVLDVFDRYNFTIKEDEPLEKEVAVDPEMLGKVFENMLEITERKSKGAFYTPREIVHYMCRESLVKYLDNAINKDKIRVPEAEIDIFVKSGFLATENKFQLPQSVRNHADLLDEHLTTIKICDPAIGSGAFPVGLLHELVTAQKVLLPHLSETYLGKKLTAIDLPKNEFTKDPSKYVYRVKRHAIQENIYGVDIDASAIDIARLRLWLSLVVDEEDFYSIEALPNLDYKIVQGNSLIGFPEEWDSPAFDKIEDLKEKFFNETDNKLKVQYKDKINHEIHDRLSSSKRVFGYEIDFDFKLFFSEVWQAKKGFDIVIGNPPYDVYQGNKVNELETIKKIKHFDKAKGRKLNAFELFLCIAPIISNKGTGVISMIFQNSFLADTSSRLLRQYFLTEKDIVRIDSFPERDDVNKRVFKTAKMSVCILFVKNRKQTLPVFPLCIWQDRYFSAGTSASISPDSLLKLDPQYFSIPSVSDKEFRILEKLSKFKKLSAIAHCYEGEVNLTIHKKYLSEEKKPGYARMIKGASIHRWHLVKKMSQGVNEFLSPEYLQDLVRSEKARHHKHARLVLQGITGVDETYRLKFAMLTPDVFCGNSANYVLFNNPALSLPYMAILNSEIQNWFFKKFSTNSNVNGYEVDNLPVVDLSKAQMHVLEMLGAYISALAEAGDKGDAFRFFDRLNNAVNYELFLEDVLTKTDKSVINHIGKLAEISNVKAEQRKVAIIQNEFARLNSPNHPVRKALDELDSIEEIGIIRESLK